MSPAQNPSNPMSQSDASLIQQSQAKAGGDMSSAGFPARAQGGHNDQDDQAAHAAHAHPGDQSAMAGQTQGAKGPSGAKK